VKRVWIRVGYSPRHSAEVKPALEAVARAQPWWDERRRYEDGAVGAEVRGASYRGPEETHYGWRSWHNLSPKEASILLSALLRIPGVTTRTIVDCDSYREMTEEQLLAESPGLDRRAASL